MSSSAGNNQDETGTSNVAETSTVKNDQPNQSYSIANTVTGVKKDAEKQFSEPKKDKEKVTNESLDSFSQRYNHESISSTKEEQKRVIGPLSTDLKDLLTNHNLKLPETVEVVPIQLKLHEWGEVRIFISSSFIDTHGERDILIKRVIPKLNNKWKKKSSDYLVC